MRIFYITLIWMTLAAVQSTDCLAAEATENRPISKQKSPFLAFALSAVVPGAGELYTGDKWGLLNTAAEVGFWVGYAHYTNQADDERVEYEAYADNHWGYDRWGDWYETTGWVAIQPADLFETYADGSPVKNHHYYEKLGKYPWAQGGWDDFQDEYQVDLKTVTYSPNHLAYLDMRREKNSLNDKATRCVVAAMVNHAFSGFRAALLARSHNKKLASVLERSQVQFAASGSADNPTYWVKVSGNF